MSSRNPDELPKGLAFGSGSTKELLHATQARQQRLQRTAKAGPGTYAKQIFRTGIEIDKRPIRIDDQDGSGEAGEDISGLGRRRVSWRLRYVPDLIVVWRTKNLIVGLPTNVLPDASTTCTRRECSPRNTSENLVWVDPGSAGTIRPSR